MFAVQIACNNGRTTVKPATMLSTQLCHFKHRLLMRCDTARCLHTSYMLHCRAIKAIASGFNLVDELSVVITGLEMESRQLKSVKARESADNAINDLSAFIDQLSGGSNSSSRPGAYSKRTTNLAHARPLAPCLTCNIILCSSQLQIWLVLIVTA